MQNLSLIKRISTEKVTIQSGENELNASILELTAEFHQEGGGVSPPSREKKLSVQGKKTVRPGKKNRPSREKKLSIQGKKTVRPGKKNCPSREKKPSVQGKKTVRPGKKNRPSREKKPSV